MKFKNLSCDDAREMGKKVRELTDIICKKCDKHSELTETIKLQNETIKLQREVIKQRDTEIAILIRKKEALRDEIEEKQSIIERTYERLRVLEYVVENMEGNENA